MHVYVFVCTHMCGGVCMCGICVYTFMCPHVCVHISMCVVCMCDILRVLCTCAYICVWSVCMCAVCPCMTVCIQSVCLCASMFLCTGACMCGVCRCTHMWRPVLSAPDRETHYILFGEKSMQALLPVLSWLLQSPASLGNCSSISPTRAGQMQSQALSHGFSPLKVHK